MTNLNRPMQRLYIERFYLNRADDEYPMTVRIVLQMKDDVDRHLLEEAVAAAQTRYPYLCVKLGVECDDDVSEQCAHRRDCSCNVSRLTTSIPTHCPPCQRSGNTTCSTHAMSVVREPHSASVILANSYRGEA